MYTVMIHVTLTSVNLGNDHAGVREQALDWETAPPVHVLTYLVLGSEKDARNNMVRL